MCADTCSELFFDLHSVIVRTYVDPDALAHDTGSSTLACACNKPLQVLPVLCRPLTLDLFRISLPMS